VDVQNGVVRQSPHGALWPQSITPKYELVQIFRVAAVSRR
jgi:hypothetical protein